MSELADNISEYVQNTQEVIGMLQKEAEDYKNKLEAANRRTFIDKEAAIQVAGTLIGKGLIPAENIKQTIDNLCADPLGVITQIAKVASVQHRPVPTMGTGSAKKGGTGAFSTEELSNADKALLSRLRLI